MPQRTYLALDLKSFYASVECRERGLDPMNTNLVVVGESRTDKTICLAVTPSLKSFGIPGRPLYEVKEKVLEANARRKQKAPGSRLAGSSHFLSELQADPGLAVDFLIAPPRMDYYMRYSTRIYEIYMKYVVPEDVVVYSIDEVFMDVTNYLEAYKLTPRDLAMRIILDALKTTEITATTGIGINLYLVKVAMDIEAKHMPVDRNGVRITELYAMSYRRSLWAHRPLTDFWRVGHGYARKLEGIGLYTMGDVVRFSITNEDHLYRLFGKNAELLIDHAWGWEPCTIEAIKAFKPSTKSIESGQVLHCPCEAKKARLVLREKADLLVLDLVDKGLVTDQIVITVGYGIENLIDPERSRKYHGDVVIDRYGRKIPKHAHGTINLEMSTSSTKKIVGAASDLYDRIVNPKLLIRRLTIAANRVVDAATMKQEPQYEQMNLFKDYEAIKTEKKQEKKKLEREKSMPKAMLEIKKSSGKMRF